MANLNLARTRKLLEEFCWPDLFIDELGWNQPPAGLNARVVAEAADTFTLAPVAGLGGALVFTAASATGLIPDAKARYEVHKRLLSVYREHLLIFQDADKRQALWSWPHFDKGRLQPRTHLYVQGQPGDLFLSKLATIYFDLDELDEHGQADLLTVTERLRKALDVRPVTNKFYRAFSEQQHHLVAAVQPYLPDEGSRRHYASVLLTRLMFVYFLQKKGFLADGNMHYLEDKLREHQTQTASTPGAPATFYRHFLRPLFFEGFALRPDHRSAAVAARLGRIPYLNGGLFLPHQLEEAYPALNVPDTAIAELLNVFTGFSWHLDDRAGAKDNEINPDVLGYILEKYINSSSSKQKGAGAFYTPTEITDYLCDQTIEGWLLHTCNDPLDLTSLPGLKTYHYYSLDDLLLGLDDRLAKKLLLDVLPKLTILDPACGSGAFLVAALKKLETVYRAVVGYVEVSASDTWLKDWLQRARKHPSLTYFIRKEIITRNLYGVDLMDEAVEIARLRLFLALVAAARTSAELEPLPNIDFNLLEGNGLIGLLHIRQADFNRYAQSNHGQANLFAPDYDKLLAVKNELVDRYRGLTADLADTEVGPLRHEIQDQLDDARHTLNQVLHAHLQGYKVPFEQAQWDARKRKEIYTKQPLTQEHVASLKPFHWGYEFSRVLERGGFDIIIANPPWEAFKPNAKEFFEEYSEVVQKKNMRVEDFDKEKEQLLQDAELRHAWETYLSRFPVASSLFRTSPDYQAQVAEVNGKRTSADLNLYKLFLERCFRLLRPSGQCGIIVPTGLYTDLGAKSLRELLFDETQVKAVFGLSNERKLFEDVHHAFKYAIVVFEKGGKTVDFAAAFRIQPREAVSRDDLNRLLHNSAEHVRISVQTVKQLSPDSYSVPEFRSPLDQTILEKLAQHPALGEIIPEAPWQLRFGAEFHMTNDSDLFETSPAPGRLPLFEGKMMHQFRADFAEPRYWVPEAAGRVRVLGRTPDKGQILPYQLYRLAYRAIARSSDTRTLIVTVLPKDVFCGHSLNVDRSEMDAADALYVAAVLNSLVVDYRLRLSVSANLTLFFLYQLPIPRLSAKDPRAKELARRAAQLICITPDFDELARSVGLPGYQVLTDTQCNQLRAEIDGLVAQLYQLTPTEFDHILNTFPLVPEPTLVAARNALRDISYRSLN